MRRGGPVTSGEEPNGNPAVASITLGGGVFMPK